MCRRRPARGVRRGAESELHVQGVIQTSLSSCTPRRWKSVNHRRQANALVAAAVRGPNVAASDATRVEAEAYAAVAAVQAGDDARRAEPLAAVQAESEGRRAAAASVAATAASATAAPSLFSASPAVSEAAGVTSAEVLLWQGQVSGEFARIDGDVIRLKSTMDRLLASFETLQDAVAGGASKVENVEAMLQQFMDNVHDYFCNHH